ncbi:MAG: helix-turn-helix transcriptional regulator [Crocosphaera sp.]|nr:helix-turn-helix transcriptional regulator [Crocosphaera sp.]
MNEDTITTDKSLKDLIEQHGYTQKSFAKALNRAYSTVQFYVAGQKKPGCEILADMCRLLDESPKTVMKSLGIDVTGIPNDVESTD